MPSIEIHGIYKIPAPQACFIIELTVHDSQSALDLSEVSFEVKSGRGMGSVQAPFEEHFLSSEGAVLGDFMYGLKHPEVWKGNPRLAVLMHYLQAGELLTTPFGDVVLPVPTERPEKLAAIKYSSPY